MVEINPMTLAESIKKLRGPILGKRKTTPQMLADFVQMLKLENAEWLQAEPDKLNSQKARYLTSKAKEFGWIDACIKIGLLTASWKRWPRQDELTPEEISVLYGGVRTKSVRTISAGAVEQNRRKH